MGVMPSGRKFQGDDAPSGPACSLLKDASLTTTSMLHSARRSADWADHDIESVLHRGPGQSLVLRRTRATPTGWR